MSHPDSLSTIHWPSHGKFVGKLKCLPSRATNITIRPKLSPWQDADVGAPEFRGQRARCAMAHFRRALLLIVVFYWIILFSIKEAKLDHRAMLMWGPLSTHKPFNKMDDTGLTSEIQASGHGPPMPERSSTWVPRRSLCPTVQPETSPFRWAKYTARTTSPTQHVRPPGFLPLLVRPHGTVFQTLSAIRTPPKLL